MWVVSIRHNGRFRDASMLTWYKVIFSIDVAAVGEGYARLWVVWLKSLLPLPPHLQAMIG